MRKPVKWLNPTEAKRKKLSSHDIKNQHQQVLWYLINWDKFALIDVVKDSMFIKFQTRLSDIELKHGSLTKKTKKSFMNRFKRESQYTVYKCIDKQKAINLMKKY